MGEQAGERPEADGAAEAGERPEAAEAQSPTPEADRLFPPPTPEEAAHNLRELTWGEHITAMSMAAARGNTRSYLYSLREAAMFFLDGKRGGATLGSSGSFAWVDFDRFVAWLRDAVGDAPFADALQARLAELETDNDKIEALRQLLDLRMAQYLPYLPPDEAGIEGEAGAEGVARAEGEAGIEGEAGAEGVARAEDESAGFADES